MDTFLHRYYAIYTWNLRTELSEKVEVERQIIIFIASLKLVLCLVTLETLFTFTGPVVSEHTGSGDVTLHVQGAVSIGKTNRVICQIATPGHLSCGADQDCCTLWTKYVASNWKWNIVNFGKDKKYQLRQPEHFPNWIGRNITRFMSLQCWTQTMLFLLSVMNSGLKHMLGSTVTLAATLYRLHCLFCDESVGDEWYPALDRKTSIKMGLNLIIFALSDVPTRNHFSKLFGFNFAQFSVVFSKL